MRVFAGDEVVTKGPTGSSLGSAWPRSIASEGSWQVVEELMCHYLSVHRLVEKALDRAF